MLPLVTWEEKVSHATEQVSRSTEPPQLKNSLSFYWPFWYWEHCGCSFLGWFRSCPGTQCLGQGFRVSVSKFLSFVEAMGTGLSWDAEVQGGPSQGWALVACDNIQPFCLASILHLPSQKSTSFLSPIWLLALLLPHPIDSKHHESRTSFYP